MTNWLSPNPFGSNPKGVKSFRGLPRNWTVEKRSKGWVSIAPNGAYVHLSEYEVTLSKRPKYYSSREKAREASWVAWESAMQASF